MSIDLTYTNKAGITIKSVLDAIKDGNKSNSDIQHYVGTTKSIDTLLKKLEAANLIKKSKIGNKIIFLYDEQTKTENVTKKKAITTTPKKTKTKIETDLINKQTAVISKDHIITNLVEIDTNHPSKVDKTVSIELNENDLNLLKQTIESRTGKEVTAILHKRNDRVSKQKKPSAEEIYEQNKVVELDEEFLVDNPYRFILNFFTSTLNNEIATPYFRRRDDYVVKSIFNKFKTLCKAIDPYNILEQHLPFYRVITMDMKNLEIKIYHIDMNRVIVGIHRIFKLSEFDSHFIPSLPKTL